MNKFYFYLVVSVAFSGVVHAQEKTDVNVLKRLYSGVRDDLRSINKCYFSKSSACNENEKRVAREAVLRVGAEITGLAALLGVGAFSAWYVVKKLKMPSAATDIVDAAKKIVPSVIDVKLTGSTAAVIVPKETLVDSETGDKLLAAIQRKNSNIKAVAINKAVGEPSKLEEPASSVQSKPEPKPEVSSGKLFTEVFNIIPAVRSVTKRPKSDTESEAVLIQLPAEVYYNLTDVQRGMLSGRVYDLTSIGNIEYDITQ